MQVMEFSTVSNHFICKLIRTAVMDSTFPTPASHPARKGVWIVIASCVPLAIGRPSELAATDNQGGIQQPTLLQIAE